MLRLNDILVRLVIYAGLWTMIYTHMVSVVISLLIYAIGSGKYKIEDDIEVIPWYVSTDDTNKKQEEQ